MLDAALAQFLSHHARKRAVDGLGEVGDAELGGIGLVARAHGAEDGDAARQRRFDEIELARHGIDGVNDVVIARGEEVLAVRCIIARTDEVQANVGVDVAAARGEGIGLILPHGGVQRLDLAVQVRAAHTVVVDERQLTHARAHQRFDRVAADAAKAEHGYMTARKTRHSLVAEEHLRA